MADQNRIFRKQLLAEAEGYLDLVAVFSERWGLSPEARDRIVRRSLAALERLEQMAAAPARVSFLKGQALAKMERFEDAIVPLTEAAALDDENIHIWLALGWCYKRLGRLDLAIESLEEAIAADSSEAIIHYNLACYWSLARNERLAIGYLASALDLDPNYRDLVACEPDFDNIRKHPDFLALTTVIV